MHAFNLIILRSTITVRTLLEILGGLAAVCALYVVGWLALAYIRLFFARRTERREGTWGRGPKGRPDFRE